MMLAYAAPQGPFRRRRPLVFIRRPPVVPYGVFRPVLLPLPPPHMFFLRWQQQRNRIRNHPNALLSEPTTLDGDADQDPGTEKVVVRDVWASNLDKEFEIIAGLIEKYPYVSIDTEFPGVIFKPRDNNHRNLRPADKYRLLKLNVDALNLIQVGLTLSDKEGNLPDLGTDGKHNYVWQFNFRDFNVARDAHALDSVALLHRQGIDFRRNAVAGVSSARFAELLATSGLLFNDAVTWVNFHGAYDFAYLVKILTRQFLPNTLEDFILVLGKWFGKNVYDLKHVMQFCDGLYGGLERVAEILRVERVAGKSHQAGSDSLLTLQVFHRIISIYFKQDEHHKYANVLFGLDLN